MIVILCKDLGNLRNNEGIKLESLHRNIVIVIGEIKYKENYL